MKGFRIGGIGLVMAALVVTAAGATTPDRTLAIHSNLLPFQLELEPLVEHESVTLSVSGPGNYFYRESFAAGNPIGFAIQQDGEVLADGLYTWEAVVNPRLSSEVIRSLAEARAAGDDSVADRLRETGQLPAERMLESGSFRIVQGSILTGTGPEREPGSGAPSGGMTRVPSADVRVSAPDQVIPDDLIVQGSLCVGFDCVNNENFGFDTIRLKENNLRIKFEDTSVGSFPTGDWQITANESASGGLSKLSIDDVDGGRTPFTIEDNAPTNSLYVEGDGDIGLGTANPVVRLHLVDGDTPALRLQQDGSSGFQAQTWDIAGNETNFFVRDATNGSTLPFRIRPGAPSSSIDIAAGGNVGIGTASPARALDIVDTNAPDNTVIEIENNGPARMRINNSSNNEVWNLGHQSPSGTGLVLSDVGDAVSEMLLDVNGNLTVAGSLTTAGGTIPDYVFAEGYDLMSLDELESFVLANRHLPRIPSAADVAATGGRINMSEFQLRLLEKIEELTLYTLQQQNSLEVLLSENQSLRERLSKLETESTR